MIANLSILFTGCLLVAYAALNVYALVRADARIFPAPPSSYQENADIFRLNSTDGTDLAATYLPAKGKDHLLIYSHGNAEDIGSARPFLQRFQAKGISVLAYDYPGYGTSRGRPTEQGCYAAIKASYLHATESLGYRPDQIVLYGRSLGSGPTTWLASRRSVAGIILDGAFTSTFRVMTEIKLLPWDRFDNYRNLPKIQTPVLLIHGTNDDMIPLQHALKNWSRIQGPRVKLFVEGAGHSNVVESAGPRYWSTVTSFIKSPPRQTLTPPDSR